MKTGTTFILLLSFFCMMQTATASPERYIGVKKCKRCHNKKTGNQIYDNWKKSAHANAYKSLYSDSARKRAQSLSLSGDPWKLNECLVCHSVDPFYPKSLFKNGFKITDGVQCETCHGAGSKYAKKRIMQAITREREVGRLTTAKKTGLISVTKDSCGTKCHRSQVEVNGQVFEKPCHSPLRKFKTIMKNALEPFH